jgi:hypothetical protein
MANQIGTRTTFNDTVGLKIDLSDMLPMLLTPHDTPMWDRFKPVSPTQNAVKHEWLEDTLPGSTDQLNGMYTMGGGTIVVDDYTKFKKGYVIKIESELMRVTATPSSATITVQTAYAGSTNASHADNSTVDIVAYAVADGADPEPFATTNRESKYNYHQVFQEKIQVSDLNEWAVVYGVKDKWAYEVEKWLKVLAIRAEKSVIHGRRNEDTNNNTRTLGGLLYYITTNATAVGGALSETNLNDEIEQCYNAGGVPDLLVCSPTQKRKLSGLIASTQKYYVRPTSSESVGVAVDRYISDFGTLDILMDRHVKSDTIFVLDSSKIKIVKGHPFTLENLAKTGTARNGQIVGWYSFEVKAETHHSVMTGLT